MGVFDSFYIEKDKAPTCCRCKRLHLVMIDKKEMVELQTKDLRNCLDVFYAGDYVGDKYRYISAYDYCPHCSEMYYIHLTINEAGFWDGSWEADKELFEEGMTRCAEETLKTIQDLIKKKQEEKK